MQLKHNDERSAYITVSRYGKPFFTRRKTRPVTCCFDTNFWRISSGRIMSVIAGDSDEVSAHNRVMHVRTYRQQSTESTDASQWRRLMDATCTDRGAGCSESWRSTQCLGLLQSTPPDSVTQSDNDQFPHRLFLGPFHSPRRLALLSPNKVS